MGLRTASVRRPHVAVMAPALTDTAQSQTFKLPPKSHLEPASPINSYETKNIYLPTTGKDSCCGDRLSPLNCDDLTDSSDHLHSFDFPQKQTSDNCLNKLGGASDNTAIQNNMSMNPSPMGDQQEDKMGIQKTGFNISNMHNSKNSSTVSDVDQIFNSAICSSNDLGQNVEDIMQQVIKSIESSERLNNGPSDLNEEVLDLGNNFASFEKDLLEDVDVMNITMEDQQDELETEHKIKESHAKDFLSDLQTKHAKVERRLDFLRRRVYKLQSRFMGQHVSGEIAGVFEQVQRSLKRSKDTHESKTFTEINLLGETIEKPRAMLNSSTKILLRKLEMSSILQANTASRQKNMAKYFGSGSIELPTFRSNITGMVNIPPWTPENKYELQKVTGQLQSELGLVQKQVDSEATESSSGGESCDEMQIYNNPHQQYLSIQKRALWRYSIDRAAIAARWTWLQSQISDLEYRIRQHTDLHKQIRTGKGPVLLGGPNPPPPSSVATSPTAINGYRGQLPGATPGKAAASLASQGKASVASPSKTEDIGVGGDCQCSRTRPLVNFRKRKLLQVGGLHAVSKKAARPSTIRCGCVPPAVPCALCTGRTDPTHPRDPPETLSKSERVALLDPSFHPVFSLPEDTSQTLHLEAIMKTFDWQQRSTRMKTLKVLAKPDRLESKSLEHRTKKLEHRKKYGRLKPSTVSALSEKIKNKIRGRKAGRLNRLKKRQAKLAMNQLGCSLSADGIDDEVEALGGDSGHSLGLRSMDSPSSSPLLQTQTYNRNRNRVDSYDIDNIVIPYSVAALTRVEKLQYKEILTPKWRIADPDFPSRCKPQNNGAVQDTSQDSDVEDLCEEAVQGRHDRCEHDEKKKFLSYLKLPVGYGARGGRAHKRTDSLAESSGANTPDPMSPHAAETAEGAAGTTPITSPPATPQPAEDCGPLPSIALMRRRTISSCRFREMREDSLSSAPDIVEVAPYDSRTFPLEEEAYASMLSAMPENHHLTNSRAQDRDSSSPVEGVRYLRVKGYDERTGSPADSESTESAIGDDGEEDPNDPEWMEMEKESRHKR